MTANNPTPQAVCSILAALISIVFVAADLSANAANAEIGHVALLVFAAAIMWCLAYCMLVVGYWGVALAISLFMAPISALRNQEAI